MACQLLLAILAGAGHVDRAKRVFWACNDGAVGDAKHMILECTALAPLRQQHAESDLSQCAPFSLSRTIWGF